MTKGTFLKSLLDGGPTTERQHEADQPSDVVERVAKAMHDLINVGLAWETRSEFRKVAWRNQAKAAIAAMRQAEQPPASLADMDMREQHFMGDAAIRKDAEPSGPRVRTSPETLNRCPFCGAEVQFRKALHISDGNTDAIIHKKPTECGLVEFSNGTYDESILALWNARTAVTQGEIRYDAHLFEAVCDEMERGYRKTDEDCRFHDVGALRGYIHLFLERYIAAQPVRESGWLPIGTAPKDGTKVIVANWKGSDPLAHTAWWARLPGCWENPLTNRELKPTHWMPLKRPTEC